MKNCLKCNISHDKKGSHCSRRCANSRVWSDADKLKKRMSFKKFYNNLSLKDKNLWNYRLIKLKKKKILDWIQFNIKNFECVGNISKKKVLIYKFGYKCFICKISKWRNKRISLELDHIDGNKKNNKENNFRLLCPNCHSQTMTWRGKKNSIKSIKQKSLEKILTLRGYHEQESRT